MSQLARERQVLRPSQLNALARDLLEGSFAQVWVEGEISNFSRPASGHAYFTLKEAQPTAVGDTVEVLEIFSYACSHCGQLDPVLVKWEKNKPAEAELRYMPAVWQKPGWVEYAAAFYTAEKMGILKQSHHALMDLLWVQN